MVARIVSVTALALPLLVVACGGGSEAGQDGAERAAVSNDHAVDAGPSNALAPAVAPDASAVDKDDAGAKAPLTVGCDGVLGSKAVVDACGICGGDGSSCKPCDATMFGHDEQSNGTFVDFILPSAPSGTEKTFLDGRHYDYRFPTCHQIAWSAVKFTCEKGSWVLGASASFQASYFCGPDQNDSQPGLTAGLQ